MGSDLEVTFKLPLGQMKPKTEHKTTECSHQSIGALVLKFRKPDSRSTLVGYRTSLTDLLRSFRKSGSTLELSQLELTCCFCFSLVLALMADEILDQAKRSRPKRQSFMQGEPNFDLALSCSWLLFP